MNRFTFTPARQAAPRRPQQACTGEPMPGAGSGTEVREVCEILRDLPFFVRWSQRRGMGVKDRKADLETNIRKTLGALKAEAERTAAQAS